MASTDTAIIERKPRQRADVLSPDALSILFAAGNLSLQNAGPYHSLQQTVRALAQRGHRAIIVGSRRKADEPSHRLTEETHAFRMYGPASLHFAPALAGWLERQPDNWDVVSMQAVWLHTNRAVADWCRRHGKPFMLTARGAFNTEALKISAWKKWVAQKTFMRPVFAHARCYQALNGSEYGVLRDFGIRAPICIIPNGIELPDLGGLPAAETLLPQDLLARRTCLYLGRLHPIKGVDRLLRAWGRVRPSDDWQLVIAGDGEKAFCTELEDTARRAQCRNVHFVGAVAGDHKAMWFRHAELFVLPSRSEGFPMALNEAFSYGTPALITSTCNFPDAAAAGVAVEVASTEDGIADGLQQMLQMGVEPLRAMGNAARVFVGKHYSWQDICVQLEAVYAWMRSEGPAPPCLHLN